MIEFTLYHPGSDPQSTSYIIHAGHAVKYLCLLADAYSAVIFFHFIAHVPLLGR